MISLKNINIKFEKEIISNGEIMIRDSSITAIVGKSGCGKTSLLYLIGLIATNDNYEYNFDGQKINLSIDSAVSQIRKTKIGYIFQDNTLIESMSVKNNIFLASKIAGKPASDADIEKYLEYVELSIDSNIYPRKLSGGEQQRVAIACAMAKNPDLIIADEPTSALDRDNAEIVMNIFRRYAHEYGKKVVIATHNENIYKTADYVYEIKNQRVVEKTEETNSTKHFQEKIEKQKELVKVRPLGLLFFLKYTKITSKRMRIQRSLMMLLCAVAIAFSVTISTMGEGFINEQRKLINQISNREIFLVNLTTPSSQILDYDENISISDTHKQSIESISSIDVIYPYYEFRSIGYLIDTGEASSTSIITITTDNGTKEFTFSNDSDYKIATVVIAPYYEEQSYEKQLINSFETESSDKVYLSAQLADILEVDQEKFSNISMRISINIPVMTTPVDLVVNNNSNQENSGTTIHPADIDCSILTELDFKIAGILNSNVSNMYSNSGNNIIYMPIDMMKEILEEVQIDFNSSTNTLETEVPIQKWSPSAYMIYVKNYNDIDTVIHKINSISSDFVCKSNYQDIESMNLMISNVRRTMTGVSTIVLLIIILLMAIVFSNYVLSRKFETAVLKANGLTKIEILKIILVECSILMLRIFIVSVVMSLIISFIVNILFSFELITFSWITILMLLIVSAVATLFPTLSSAIIMNNVKPDRIFRN